MRNRIFYQTAWLVGLLILTLGPMLPAQAQVRSRTVTVSPKKTTADSTAVRSGVRTGTTTTNRVGERRDTATTNRVGVRRDTTTTNRVGVRRDTSNTARAVVRSGVTTANRVGVHRDTPATVRASTFAAAAAEVLRLTNVERARASCPRLVIHDSLTAAAMAHSEDMASHRKLGHSGSDGRSSSQRALGAGYAYRMIAENVAAGQWDAVQVVQAWMNSSVHRTNILNCELREIGIGAARSPDDPARETYWTQLFGIPL